MILFSQSQIKRGMTGMMQDNISKIMIISLPHTV